MIFKTITSYISIAGGKLSEINKLKLDSANINGYAAALKELSTNQAKLILSTKGLTVAQQQTVLAQINLANATGTLTTAQMTEALTTETRNKADVEALLLNTGLITSQTAEAKATNTLTSAKLKELIQTKTLTQAEAELLASKAGITLANQKELSSFSKLGIGLKNVGNSLLVLAKIHPVISIVTSAIALLTAITAIIEKKNEEFIDSQRKLIEESEKSIQKYDDEISTLNSLQVKLEESKGNKEALAQIQNELNDAIGYTPGLLNSESNAYDITNQKISDRIKRLEALKQLELNNKVSAQKEIFNNTLVDNIWGVDHKFDYFSNHKVIANDLFNAPFVDYIDEDLSNKYSTLQELFENLKKNNYGDGKKSNAEIWKELIDSYGGAMLETSEIQDFFDNQTEYAQKILSDYIDNSECIFSKEELNSIIKNLVEYGYAQDLGGIKDIITSLVENDELEATINDYYESLLNDDSDSDKLYQNIKSQFNELSNQYPELKSILDNFFNSIGTEIETEFSTVGYNKINTSFLDEWNSTDFAASKKELLDLAKSGEITSEVLTSNKDYAQLLTGTGLSAESAMSKILDLLSVQEKLASASNGLKQLQSSYEEFRDVGFVTAATLEAIPDTFKNLEGFDLFSEIAGDPTQGQDNIQQAFNDIVKQYLISQDTFSSLISANENDIQRYIANLEQIGIINAEAVVIQVVNALTQENQLINEAEKEYMKYLECKDTADTAYLENLTIKNGQLASALGRPYQTDYNNWCNLLTKKSEAYNKFVNSINGIEIEVESAPFADYEEGMTIAKANAILKESYGKTVISGLTAGIDPWNNPKTNNNISIYTQEQVNAAREYLESVKASEEMKNTLKLDLSTIETDFNTDFSPVSSRSGNTSSNTTAETFNFLETLINRLTSALNRLKTAGENTFKSLAARTGAYDSALSVVSKQLETQQQAYDIYMAKANAVGLDEYWASQVRDGSINIADITDEDLKQKIKDYQTWYEKCLDCRDAIEDLEQQQTKLLQAKIELQITHYDNLLEKLSGANDRIQNKIGLKESWGFTAGISGYSDMNKNLRKQIDNTTKQNEELKKLLATVDEGSEAWYEYNQRIDSNNASMQDLKKTMAENAKAAAALAGETASNKVEKYQNIIFLSLLTYLNL